VGFIQQLQAWLKDDDFLLALTVAQLIWLRRNSSIFGGEFSHPLQVSRVALEAVDSFKSANHSSAGGVQQQVLKGAKWNCPTAGFLKLNWDVALCKNSKSMGVGVVIRGEQGRVRAALAKFIPHVLDPTNAEALDLW
jgi:hypothetical protein